MARNFEGWAGWGELDRITGFGDSSGVLGICGPPGGEGSSELYDNDYQYLGGTVRRIAAGVFKARCLSVIEEVQATGEPVVITKRGAPVVQVTRVVSGKGDVFGFMAGEFKIVGDIESPVVSEKKRMSETCKGKNQT